MKLIDNAQHAWKMFSVQAQVIAITMITVWQTMIPMDMKASLPPTMQWVVLIGVLFAGTVGRLVKQESVSGPSK
jgi:hypothetical protein